MCRHLLHDHIVVLARTGCTSLHRSDNFTSNLGTDRGMWSRSDDIKQRVLLVGSQVRRVPKQSANAQTHARVTLD